MYSCKLMTYAVVNDHEQQEVAAPVSDFKMITDSEANVRKIGVYHPSSAHKFDSQAAMFGRWNCDGNLRYF